MGGRGRPVEGSRNHFPLIDHRELVMEILEMDLSPGFSWILTPLKIFVEPEGFGREERAKAGYELEDDPSFCLRAALSHIAH